METIIGHLYVPVVTLIVIFINISIIFFPLLTGQENWTKKRKSKKKSNVKIKL